MDYYQILGVHPKAGQEEIEQAYKKFASMQVSPSESRLIEDAYIILSDPKKRADYDQINGNLHVRSNLGSRGGKSTASAQKIGRNKGNEKTFPKWKKYLYLALLILIIIVLVLVAIGAIVLLAPLILILSLVALIFAWFKK